MIKINQLLLFLSLLSLQACGPSQTTECQSYIACQHYYDELHDRAKTELNKYESNGICWESEDLAEDCNKTCKAKFESIVESLTDEEKSVICKL